MTKRYLNIVKNIVISLISLVALSLLLTLAFRNQIAMVALNQVNKVINGQLSADSIDLMLFKNLPSTGLKLKGAKLLDDKGETIISVGYLELNLEPGQLLDKKIVINSIILKDGTINIETDDDGNTNIGNILDGAPKEESTTAPTTETSKNNITLDIQDINIEDVYISLEGTENNISLTLDQLSLRGGLNQYKSNITLGVTLSNIKSNHIPEFWTLDKRVSLNIDLLNSKENRILELISGSVTLEKEDSSIELNASGQIGTEAPYNTILEIETAGIDAQTISMLLPKDVQIGDVEIIGNGTLDIGATIQGPLAGLNPEIDASVVCSDISLRHIPTKSTLEDLNFQLNLDYGGEIPIFTLNDLSGTLINNNFKFDASVSGSKDLKMELYGKADIDLEELALFFRFPGSEDISGRLGVDIDISQRFNIKGELLGKPTGIGEINLFGVNWAVPNSDITLQNTDVSIVTSNKFLDIRGFKSQTSLGEINAQIEVRNIWPYILGINSPLLLDMKIDSPRLTVPDFLNREAGSTGLELTDLFLNAVLTMDSQKILDNSTVEIKELKATENKYSKELAFSGGVSIKERNLTINTDMNINNSDLKISAEINNLTALLTGKNNQEISGKLQLSSNEIRGNDLIFDGVNSDSVYLNKNITDVNLDLSVSLLSDILLNTKGALPNGSISIKKLTANFPNHEFNISNITLEATVKEDKVTLNTLSVKTGESDFNISGELSPLTKLLDEDRTAIDGKLNIDVASLDINKYQTFISEDDTTDNETTNNSTEPTQKPLNAEKNYKYSLPNLTLNLLVKDLEFGDFTFKEIRGGAQTTRSGKIILNKTFIKTDRGELTANSSFDISNQEYISMEGSLDSDNLDLTVLSFPLKVENEIVDISEHIKGLFNGTINLSGKMSRDYVLDYNSLEATIEMNLKQGEIINFPPLTAIATEFNKIEFTHLKFSNLDTKITLSEGKFDLVPTGIGSNIGYIEIEGDMTDEPFINFQLVIPSRLILSTAFSLLTKNGDEKEEVIYTTNNSGVVKTYVNAIGYLDDISIKLGKNRKNRLEEQYRKKKEKE